MTSIDLADRFRNVVLEPESDAPRHAYAAACLEAGDEMRSRFIELQIEAHHRDRSPYAAPHSAFLEAYALVEKHGPQWAGAIGSRVDRYAFYRGFVEEIEIDAKRFLDSGAELYALAPVRKLFITGLRPVMKEFLASPLLRQIAVLYVEYQHIGDEGVRLIAASPHLGKLVALGLCGNDVTLEGVEALAATTTLPSLKDVSLDGNPAEVVKEIVSYDGMDPRIIWAEGSVEAEKIEAKYGRKTWLHTVEDHGYRIPLVFAEC